jgi:uncharacterized protein YqhQ
LPPSSLLSHPILNFRCGDFFIFPFFFFFFLVFFFFIIPFPLMLRAMVRRISRATLNPRVLAAEYAVRGEIVAAAGRYAGMIARGEGADLPFDKVIRCGGEYE